MNKADYFKSNIRIQQISTERAPQKSLSPFILLLGAALLSDLLTPFLIWKGVLPAATRWISSGIIVIIIILLYFRMMILDKIPAAMWVISAFALIGSTLALVNGQGILATIWGLWLMFRYPLVGIFIYLQPSLPEQTPQHLRKICIAILTFEVLVQIGQYLTGERPGDNLTGTFGWHATEPLVSFILFVLCLVTGQWLVDKRWKNLVWVVALGTISSVLAEIKFFLPASLALLGLGIMIHILQSGHVWKLIPYVMFLGINVFVFIVGYKTLVPFSNKRPIESFITDSEVLNRYENMYYQSHISGNYIMGRSRSVRYGWDSITRDPVTFLFGMGIGARGNSLSLGISGIAFIDGFKIYSARSGLLIFIQETGLLGMTAIGVFILWSAFSQFRAIKRDPKSPVTELRYALVLFSLLWPLWLYYGTVWNHEVVMLLYWASLGYVFGEANRKQIGFQMPTGNSPFPDNMETGS